MSRREPRAAERQGWSAARWTLPLVLVGLAPAGAEASPWPLGLRVSVSDPGDDADASGEAADGDESDGAEGDDSLKAAQAAYEEGTQAYALGNFDQAVAAFERSYSLSGRPELLFNLGQSYAHWYTLSEDLGHLRKARALFDNYVKFLRESDPPDQEAIDDAEARIAEVERLLAEAKEGPAPAPGPEPDPGPDPGIDAGTPPADDAPPAKRPLVRRGWFWGVVVGGALLVAGAVTAGVLLSRDNGTFEPELGTIRGAALPTAQGPALLRF
ncbi:MAG: hypothetical protein KC486_10900 [Myxococcales bacterium]|nr:hypothetical protein [Myxococcales bacterium]